MRSRLFWLAISILVLQPASGSAQSLPRSTPEAQGISSSDVQAFVEAASHDIDTMNSFMLVRHGHVVAEGWWSPYNAQTPHILYSLTKSFTSSAVGMAVAEGKLTLDDPVLKWVSSDSEEDLPSNLKEMRIRDLIRMGTGHDTEPDFRNSEKPWVQTFLEHPVPHRPGTHFLYNTPASHMLSVIVEAATGQTTESFVSNRLFEPLGIEDHQWLKSPAGHTLGGYGLSVRTEDIAKFGQLYLQEGQWQGVQLLPDAWVHQATSLQIANGSAPDSDWSQGYGFQFWRSRHNSFRGDGAFGQYCIVIPEHDTVIAITSGVRDMQAVMNLVFEHLLPALRASALPEAPEATDQLRQTMSLLRVEYPDGQLKPATVAEVSGRTYRFAANDWGIQSVKLDVGDTQDRLTVRTTQGRYTYAIGRNEWVAGEQAYALGIESMPGVERDKLTIAASGAWPESDLYQLKLIATQTPFYMRVSLQFADDGLRLKVEPNVTFGSPVIELLGS